MILFIGFKIIFIFNKWKKKKRLKIHFFWLY